MVGQVFRVLVVVCAALVASISGVSGATKKPALKTNASSLLAMIAPQQAAKAAMLPEYGKSLPPVGYVHFCSRGEAECRAAGGKRERIALSAKGWDQLNQVNHFVNATVKPSSDMDLYHVAEYWTYAGNQGDCEDYALLKKKLLTQLGFNADTLLMTVLLDEHGEGHAVLTVMTEGRDLILDNRRNDVLAVNQTSYKFLKRQSQLDPKQWVSLKNTDTQVLVSSQSH